MRLMRGQQLNLPGRIERSINEHRVLIDALTERDAGHAERAMHDHLMAQLKALHQLRRVGAAAAAGPVKSKKPQGRSAHAR